MAGIQETARQHRREILALDAQLARGLLDAYSAAWQLRIKPALDLLTARIQAARDAGQEPDAGWLARESRLRDLEQQVIREITYIGRMANGAIGAARWEAIRLAEQHAAAATAAAMGPPPAGVFFAFNRLPAQAVRALLADLAPGASLGALLEELVPAARAAVKAALTEGVILGESPAQIARRVRTALGGNAVRAVTIARTETLRAYREANRASYQAAGVVAGWRWLASLTTRSCSFCWAMHGSEHPLSAPMATHPRCRCTMTPILKAEFAGDQPAPETGPDAFDRLEAEQQRAILGNAKYAALKAGQISLSDLAATKRTRDWGRVGYEPSLSSIVGAERARKLIAGARA